MSLSPLNQEKTWMLRYFFSRKEGLKYLAQHSEWHLHATYVTYTIDVDELKEIKRSRGL